MAYRSQSGELSALLEVCRLVGEESCRLEDVPSALLTQKGSGGSWPGMQAHPHFLALERRPAAVPSHSKNRSLNGSQESVTFAHSPVPPLPSSRQIPGGPCYSCGATEAPQWRRPDPGNMLLCNRCGIHFMRYKKLPGPKHVPASSGLSKPQPDSPTNLATIGKRKAFDSIATDTQATKNLGLSSSPPLPSRLSSQPSLTHSASGSEPAAMLVPKACVRRPPNGGSNSTSSSGPPLRPTASSGSRPLASASLSSQFLARLEHCQPHEHRGAGRVQHMDPSLGGMMGPGMPCTAQSAQPPLDMQTLGPAMMFMQHRSRAVSHGRMNIQGGGAPEYAQDTLSMTQMLQSRTVGAAELWPVSQAMLMAHNSYNHAPVHASMPIAAAAGRGPLPPSQLPLPLSLPQPLSLPLALSLPQPLPQSQPHRQPVRMPHNYQSAGISMPQQMLSMPDQSRTAHSEHHHHNNSSGNGHAVAVLSLLDQPEPVHGAARSVAGQEDAKIGVGRVRKPGPGSQGPRHPLDGGSADDVEMEECASPYTTAVYF